jgi:ketosteroid isomerase-like protein
MAPYTSVATPSRTLSRIPRTGRFSAPIARQVEVVRRLFDAFERRDVDGALELLDPDIRFFSVTAHLAGDGRPYEGHAGIREYFLDAVELWEELELVPLEYQAVVGVVVVIGEVRARAGAGGYTAPVVWTWKLRGERVVEGSIHSDLSCAREALGLTSGARSR